MSVRAPTASGERSPESTVVLLLAAARLAVRLDDAARDADQLCEKHGAVDAFGREPMRRMRER